MVAPHYSTPRRRRPLSLTLMELLATRLSPQAGKSMVIPREGGGDMAIATRAPRHALPLSLRGRGVGERVNRPPRAKLTPGKQRSPRR